MTHDSDVGCYQRRMWCWVIVLGLSLVFVGGAVAQEITTEFDETADFSKFKTFAIRDGVLRSPHPALNSELTKKHLEEAIERELTARGLKKAVGSSDLTLSYIMGSRPAVETELSPAGRRGGGTRVARVASTEGNLIIDLREAATRSLVWHTVATVEEETPAKVAKRLGDMVKKSMAKYPPKK